MEQEIDIFTKQPIEPTAPPAEDKPAAAPVVEFSPHGKDLFGDAIKPVNQPPLKTRFLFPPFSVLNAQQGDWQDRKRAWIGFGLKSELGRGENANPGGSLMPATDYSTKERGDSTVKKASEALLFKSQNRLNEIMKQKQSASHKGGLTFSTTCNPYRDPDGTTEISGTSIFDPVLCELLYKWFSDDGYQVVDPFSGGSVRGVVACCLGRKYWGSDLSENQIAANRDQGKLLVPDNQPIWVNGDSSKTLADAPECDMVMSCPPYGDLEVYSEKAEDLSNMSWEEFKPAYYDIIGKACAKLRNNRFACFVVGNFRDKSGGYCDLVTETILAFQKAGLVYYNEMILVTAIGSLPIRINKQFAAGRKIGKTHQNILVFWKGDPSKVADTTREWKLSTQLNTEKP